MHLYLYMSHSVLWLSHMVLVNCFLHMCHEVQPGLGSNVPNPSAAPYSGGCGPGTSLYTIRKVYYHLSPRCISPGATCRAESGHASWCAIDQVLPKQIWLVALCRSRASTAEALPEEKDIQLGTVQECNTHMLQVKSLLQHRTKVNAFRSS